MKNPPKRVGPAIHPRELSVVVDTMLQGLGRYLRCCGVNVKILSAQQTHYDTVKVMTVALCDTPLLYTHTTFVAGLFLGIKYMLVTWLFSVLTDLPEGRQNHSYIWDTLLRGRLHYLL